MAGESGGATRCETERCIAAVVVVIVAFFFSFTVVGAVFFAVDDDVFPASFLPSIPYLFDLDEVRVVELELALGSLWVHEQFAR